MDNHRFLIAFKLSLVTVFFPLMLLDLLLPYGFLWVVFVLWIVSTIILYVYLPPKKELNLRERIKNPRVSRLHLPISSRMASGEKGERYHSKR